AVSRANLKVDTIETGNSQIIRDTDAESDTVFDKNIGLRINPRNNSRRAIRSRGTGEQFHLGRRDMSVTRFRAEGHPEAKLAGSGEKCLTAAHRRTVRQIVPPVQNMAMPLPGHIIRQQM